MRTVRSNFRSRTELHWSHINASFTLTPSSKDSLEYAEGSVVSVRGLKALARLCGSEVGRRQLSQETRDKLTSMLHAFHSPLNKAYSVDCCTRLLVPFA